jgi:hypothetical protein
MEISKRILIRSCFALMLLCTLCGMKPQSVQAQGGVSSLGTDFWMGFMPDYTFPADYVRVFICSGTANHVVIQLYGGGNGGPIQSLTVDLPPNTARTITLDVAKAETRVTETPAYRAVHVTATNPLACYGFSNQYATSDGFLALPTPALGNEYYTANFNDDYYSSPSEPLAGEFLIVAPFDHTNVTITTKNDTRIDPLGNITGHSQGIPWTVELMKGQTYLVQSIGRDKGADITGSHVTSDKPIGLITGHQRCAIPNDDPNLTSKDLLAEMIPPLDKWGTQYFDMPMKYRTKCGDYIRLISGANGNDIQVGTGTHVYLDAGEFAERPFVLAPESYTSVKKLPFLTMQYSYTEGINGDPAPADPFMITMTPAEQFQSKIIFRTPKNPNNNGDFIHFSTFVGDASKLMNIKLNNKSLLSWGADPVKTFPGTSNPVMGATRLQLPPSENTYIAVSPDSKFGLYLYGFTSVDGYGWPAGMALNVPSKDTLPPLEAKRIEICGDFTVHLNEPRHIPSFSFEDTRISSVELITDPADLRWTKPSFNYILTVDPKFLAGDSTADYTLNVQDLTQNAYAAVYTVDRAGNDTVYQYAYTAPKLIVTPAPIYDFAPALVDNQVCKTVTFKNGQATGDLHLTNASILGSAQHGSFTLTPSSIDKILHPGDSMQVQLCYTASDTGVSNISLDTLQISAGCPIYHYPLTGYGVTPLIVADDLNFGVIDSGKSVCKDLKVANVGTADLIINKQDLINTVDFSINPAQVFPIILKPGQSVNINYCFHPSKTGPFTTLSIFATGNPARFLHSIKDTSNLIGQALSPGAKLTSYDKNFGIATCSEKPTLVDTLYNNMTRAETIDSVLITGKDAASFRIVGYKPNNPYPYQLDIQPGLPGVEYTIQFDPTVKGINSGVRTAQLDAYGHSGEHIVAILTANSKAPKLTLAPGAGTTVDMGTTLISQTLTKTFTITNTGTDDMTVGSVTPTGADAANFTVTPVAPFTLAPGASQIMTVSFTGTIARAYNAVIQVNPTGNTCVIPDGQPVKAQLTSTAYLVLGADYQTVFTCKNKSLSGTFQNLSSNDTVMLQSVVVANSGAWTNAADFAQTPALTFPIAVPPQGKVIVPVRFAPTATGVRNAGLIFTFDAPLGTQSQTALLTGIGDNIPEVLGVGNVTTGVTLTGYANDIVDLPIMLSKPFQNLTPDVYGYDFKLTWMQDAFEYGSVSGPSGVTVVKVGSTVDPVTHLETTEFKATSPNPLSSESQLATVKVRVMVDTSLSTAITVSDIQFLDQSGNASLCYISSTPVNGAFNFVARCGDNTVKDLLSGRNLVLTIGKTEPNPFHTTTTIQYDVRQPLANVTLGIFDALGNEVARLVDNKMVPAGHYSAKFDGARISSGTYFCRITDGTNTATKELILSK